MSAIGIVALTIFGLGLAILSILAFVLRAIFTRQGSNMEDETKLVQDMHRTLGRLEERVAVLETLLNERQGRSTHGEHNGL
jgi:hypothetical protein